MCKAIAFNLFTFIAFLGFVLGGGCAPRSETVPMSAPSSATSSGTTDSPEAAELGANDASTAQESVDESLQVSVSLASYEELLEKIAKLSGKVVVVDVWSTSCIPCMREFPNLVSLGSKYPEQVACISMNVDYIGLPKKPAETYLPKVQEFLLKQKANITNFVSSDPDTDILEKFEVGAMPAILVYDAEGKLVERFTDSNTGDDGLTYEGDVIPLIEKLLESN